MKFLMRRSLGFIFFVNIIACQNAYGAMPSAESQVQRRTSRRELYPPPDPMAIFSQSSPIPSTTSFLSDFAVLARKGDLDAIQSNISNVSSDDIFQGFMQAIESGKSDVVQYLLEYAAEHMYQECLSVVEVGLQKAIGAEQFEIAQLILPYIVSIDFLQGVPQMLDVVGKQSIRDCSVAIEETEQVLKNHMRQLMQPR